MRIKELREEKGLTQTEVAAAIGGSQSNWEKKLVDPPSDAVCKLANFFNVSTDYLLGRTDDFGSVVMPSPTVPQLSAEQKELLKIFDELLPETKKDVLDVIRIMAKKDTLAKT